MASNPQDISRFFKIHHSQIPNPNMPNHHPVFSTHHSHLALRQEGEIFFSKLLHLESSTPQRRFIAIPGWFRSNDTMTGGKCLQRNENVDAQKNIWKKQVVV